MPSVRDLRDRIRSLKNTQQITKAMKQVAAAKIRRAEAAQKRARPYADALAQMLHDLIGAVSSVDHPFMQPGKSGAPAGIVLVSADKGLAGAFNSNVIHAAEALARRQGGARYYTIGLKARNAVRRMGMPDHATWALGSGEKIDTARAAARRASDDFRHGEISEIVLVSQQLITMMSQRPQTRKLIPILASDFESARDGEAGGRPRGAIEFAPSPEFVLSRLLPKYLEFTIYSAMLETDAAFFAAQLVAMTNATDNASKLIDELTIAMNNARQAAITKELLEIVAGAEALGVE
ncbi:MAG: ATP synthase F1 subunit gamma [Candidatus Eremiobacteraeota bacterium]|nr:ATP synthase F1 subunit gamma [Candidatus Eremiobacteraeota bacterium]MBV8499853.1 ATP synthase F1 subunit gamma [Candidatus Eremiobacteraeota bacterium]